MRCFSNLLCVAVFLFSFSYAASAGIPGPDTPFDWAAYPGIGPGIHTNPAALSFINGLKLRIGFAASDSAFEKIDLIDIAVPGIGFSVWRGDDSIRRYSIGGASVIAGDVISAGFSYSWFDTKYTGSRWHDKSCWNAGITVRPVSWGGFGLFYSSGIDIPGEDVPDQVGAGVAFRPFSERYTLTSDMRTDSDFDDVDFSCGIEARPLEGLSILGDICEDGFHVGIGMDFGNIGISGAGNFSDNADYSSARGEIEFSTSPMENLMGSGGRFVRFEPNKTEELPSRAFLGPRQPGFTEQMMLLNRLIDDPSVDGLILDVKSSAGNLAQAEELRAMLARFEATERPVYLFLEYAGNGECYLASVGTTFIHPSGQIALTGMSSTSFFTRDLLDNLGIYPDLLHIGEFKSASEMFTRSDMSEAQRVATVALLESMQSEIINAVSSGRNLEPARIDEILENGLYTAQMSVDAGLADGISREDEIREKIEEDLGRGISIISLDSYRSTIPDAIAWGPEPHVAVVIATGMIHGGESGSVFPFGRTMGSQTVIDNLEKAASAPGVKALVLRIDSGGGEGMASDDILHAIKKIQERMPVVISMGGVAASGGYCIACSGDRIYADAMTITGSIGTICGKFSFGGLLEKIGVTTEQTTISPLGGMGSPFRQYTDRERSRLFEMMSDSYDMFVNDVAEGRGMTWEEVDAIGRGRVWTGADALDIGLVDNIGGVVDAILCAANLGEIEGRQPPIRVYPEPSALGAFNFSGPFGIGMNTQNFLPDLFTDGRMLYMTAPLQVE